MVLQKHLSNIFGELVLRATKNAIILILVAIFLICQQITIGHRHMQWMFWWTRICVLVNRIIKNFFLCGGKVCPNIILPEK